MANQFLRINATTDEISWTTSPGTDPVVAIETSTDVPEWRVGGPGGGYTILLIDDATDVPFWL